MGRLSDAQRRGIGLVAMRERAELMGGKLNFRVRPRRHLVHLTVPREKRRLMEKKITVLLVDDHSLVRRGFRRMLEDEPDMEVVGEAGDGEESVKLAKELHPQVVVMDCALPGMNGSRPHARSSKARPKPRC